MSPSPIYDELKEQYFGIREICKSPEFTLYDDGDSILLVDREEPIVDEHPTFEEVAPIPTCGNVECEVKRHKARKKGKLFGRNQYCQGTL